MDSINELKYIIIDGQYPVIFPACIYHRDMYALVSRSVPGPVTGAGYVRVSAGNNGVPNLEVFGESIGFNLKARESDKRVILAALDQNDEIDAAIFRNEDVVPKYDVIEIKRQPDIEEGMFPVASQETSSEPDIEEGMFPFASQKTSTEPDIEEGMFPFASQDTSSEPYYKKFSKRRY
jgi:hypothetical protein